MNTNHSGPTIQVHGLRKSYGRQVVLDGIDFEIAQGTVFSMLGPNGAGKTTTVQILSTLISADEGHVLVAGHDLSREPDAIRAAIGVTGQFSAVDKFLTGEENLVLMADLRHMGKHDGRRRAAELLDRFDLAEAAGYFHTVPDFEDHFVDLNLDEVTRVRPSAQFSRIKKLYLPNSALGTDLLVSIAKMKTHHWVGATLSMKNLFGVVPSGIYGWPKNVLHWAGIDESIADLHAAFPRHFAIVDGIVGMEGNGPIQGTAKHAGVLVAGKDPVAVDATCCRIMRIDPMRIP